MIHDTAGSVPLLMSAAKSSGPVGPPVRPGLDFGTLGPQYPKALWKSVGLFDFLYWSKYIKTFLHTNIERRLPGT